MSVAWIGIGANQDNPVNRVTQALEGIAAADGVTLEARSSLYRTAPQDYQQQADFINAVVRVKTTLQPLALLDILQDLESRLGRVRQGPRFGPRQIDIDLLMFDSLQCSGERLELPHPRLHRRLFVLQPLEEIDADVEIPGLGRVDALIASCETQRVSRIDPADIPDDH
jgi:2-amino-4-hydroxy-6-hydroxymethyldihydropteridine diphosphokinase